MLLKQLSLLFIFVGSNNCLTETKSEQQNDDKNNQDILIIISYDAFRNEYFQRNLTNNMLKFKTMGTSSNYINNIFPTKTFPNHHTIATGLYPENHGVLGNTLYDNILGPLNISYSLYHYRDDIEPIWIFNQKVDIKHYSGCMMWPGSMFSYQNMKCHFTQDFNKTIPWEQRVDLAIEWIKHPITPANLVMMYFEEPDMHGHAFGPDSVVINNLIELLDNLTSYIQMKLIENNLINNVNVIHLSDHGMDSVTLNNFIDLNSYINYPNTTYKFYGSSPVLQIVPDKDKINEIYESLVRAAKLTSNFDVYKNDNLPTRWHCNNERRFGPITAVARLGYAFQDMWPSIYYYEKAYNIPVSKEHKYGIHGYDNLLPTMHPFFMAKGPKIKENHIASPFSTVDLYNLFCLLLNIPVTNKTNGTLDNILDVLKDVKGVETSPSSLTPNVPNNRKHISTAMVALLSAMATFSLVAFLSVIAILYIKKRRKQHIETLNILDGGTTLMEQCSLLQNSQQLINNETQQQEHTTLMNYVVGIIGGNNNYATTLNTTNNINGINLPVTSTPPSLNYIQNNLNLSDEDDIKLDR